LPLVPAVADAVAPVPVLAAGGIADGRGVAAALMLGAQGAVLGSRFCATPEARAQFTVGHQAGDPDVAMVWAGEGTDLITSVEPAGSLVTQIMAQADGLLRGAPRQLDH
jgi:NAD(P)H-dependent flavin oxidoreductase YrpB (nitropropane dioxygenase family)